MKLRISAIGSGSLGNSILIEIDNFGFLIDVGFSKRELFKRLDYYSISPENIKNILITHSHSDHIKGSKTVANILDIPTYVTRPTFERMKALNKIGNKIVLFNSSYSFFMYKFKIIPIKLCHDAIDTVGFIICYKNFKIGFVMDSGFINNNNINLLNGCDVIILESNHDIDTLRNSDRHYKVKNRIASRFGHLSNKTCIEYLKRIITPNTRNVILGHVSMQCNKYDMVESLATNCLKDMGCSASINVMRQNFIPLQINISI